jgi:hypothetical protein
MSLNLISPLINQVASITVHGNKRTQLSMIERELRAAATARSHGELAKELSTASIRLQDLDAFHSTVKRDIHIHTIHVIFLVLGCVFLCLCVCVCVSGSVENRLFF